MKDIQDHPAYSKLAKRRDDLKFILLKYGESLGLALKVVKAEYKQSESDCVALTTLLALEGWEEQS